MRSRPDPRQCGYQSLMTQTTKGRGMVRTLSAAALLAVALTACAETVTKHGHQFQETDLNQIQPGMSSGAGENHARHSDHNGDCRHRHCVLLYRQHSGPDGFFQAG